MDYKIIEFSPDQPSSLATMKINSSTEDIQGLINALLEVINQSSGEFEKLKNICFDLLCRLPIPIQLLQNTFILRGRENLNGEVFSHPQQLSYNPYPDKIDLGRFNLPGEPLFYGAAPITSHNASGQITTLCESCKELFDSTSTTDLKYFTVAKWNIQRPIRTLVLTFFDHAEDISWHLGNLNPNYIKYLSSICSAEDLNKCRSFFSFFSGFAARKYDSDSSYQLTTALFHALKERYGPDMAILYSSSMTENKGINLALSKEVLDYGYLQFEGAVMFKVTRDPRNYRSYMIVPCTDYARLDSDGLFRYGYLI